MATFTVDNDLTGKPISFHPQGRLLVVGDSLVLELGVDDPSLIKLVKAFVDSGKLTLSAGSLPSDAEINAAIAEFGEGLSRINFNLLLPKLDADAGVSDTNFAALLALP